MNYVIPSMKAFVLILLRVLPVVIFSPAFGGKMLPARMKVVVSIGLSFLILQCVDTDFSGSWLLLSGVQIFLGLLMAVLSALPFYTVQAIGEWIDLARGESLSTLLVPQLNSRTSSMGRLNLLFGIALFFTTGMHFELVHEFIQSFAIVPFDYFSQLDSSETFKSLMIELLAGRLAEFFHCTVRLGFPVVAMLWLVDLILGLFNRLIPALQVFYLGLPLKMWMGLLILSLIAPSFASEIKRLFSLFLPLLA